MSTVPSIVVDGNDLTAWLQDRSMSIKRNSFDATFVDDDGTITAIPALGDVVVVDEPAWTGTVNSVISTGYKGNHPFYRVRATNADPLPDAGAAPFNLADTGSRYSSPAGFKDLEVTRILDNAVEEVRSKCIIFKEGVTWGMEIDITSVVEGYSAETFTVMEMTVDWPIDDAATYTLDLGLGVYADAVEGPPGSGGTPDDPFLKPPTLDDEIGRIAEEHCCGDVSSPAPGDQVPVIPITAGGVCDATPTDKTLERKLLRDGTYTETYGAVANDEVVSTVVDNAPYTDVNYPCPAGGGSWWGYSDHEIWVEFTAPADDPTEYLGITTVVDISSLQIKGSPQGYEVRLAQGAGTSSRFGDGATIMDGPTSGTSFTVYIPRQFVDWGATNSLVLHPKWLSDRPISFCNPAAVFTSPYDDGRGHSGAYRLFGFDDFCPFGLTTGLTGVATAVPGVGDVDGSNAEFTLLHWTTGGAVEATVNGVPVLDSEITYDTGAGTVTLATPPATNSIVLFSYRAST